MIVMTHTPRPHRSTIPTLSLPFPTTAAPLFPSGDGRAVALHAPALPLLAAGPTLPGSSAVDVAAWIGCLFFLVAGWNQVERFLDRRTGPPVHRPGVPPPLVPSGNTTPLRVSAVSPAVTEELCRERHKESGAELARLGRELESLRRERQAGVIELQGKLSKVDREVGELRASIEMSHQQLLRMESKLDRAIERRGA